MVERKEVTDIPKDITARDILDYIEKFDLEWRKDTTTSLPILICKFNKYTVFFKRTSPLSTSWCELKVYNDQNDIIYTELNSDLTIYFNKLYDKIISYKKKQLHQDKIDFKHIIINYLLWRD